MYIYTYYVKQKRLVCRCAKTNILGYTAERRLCGSRLTHERLKREDEFDSCSIVASIRSNYRVDFCLLCIDLVSSEIFGIHLKKIVTKNVKK